VTLSPLSLPLALLFTLLLSIAGYRLIELPAMTLSKRLTPRQPMALPPAAPGG
jgi:peptidoglycan/LPS O-acetylase OafA/YrhL